MRRFYIIILFIFSLFRIQGQELRCNIQVVSQKIQGTNRSVFQTLQQALYEFMNNTVWTNHVYQNDERIECTIMLRLDKHEGDQFKGSLQVQSSRPVFNSAYNSVMFNFVDNDLDFRYVENEPIEFSPSTHISNLTSILAYYAYIIIGLDYDSFSSNGGSEFFNMAETIVNNAQNATERGWKSADGLDHKNRYWLVKDLLDSDYRNIRAFYYRYHRQGLDLLESKTAEGRSNAADAVRLLQDIYRQKPDPYMYPLQVVLDAKSNEFVNIFTESPPEEKNRVYRILTEIDPSNVNKYDNIKKEQ
ncbi:MAG: DUF4835 family protein [Bacteroidales bacterium]|nr:DUF4835 family protein [Bacteroidales bacterium]